MCCKINWRYICREWRLWIRPLIILVYVIFAIIVVPLLIVNSVKEGFTRKDQLILIGGLFVLSAVPISVWHIIQHLIHFTKPILQKHIIRILWMVPIYALNAWLGLLFPEHSIYVDSFRECYEAYVIYNFMVYLLNYLNLSMDLEATLEHKPQVKHFFPLCYIIRPWEMGREFIHNCKHGILQYTVVRPITTIISVICELCGVYGEGSFAGNVAFPYIIFINNVSQFVAMYCLVLFYQANKIDLKPMTPIPKFLCIKAVIFFSFFQGVIINFLVYIGYIKDIFGSGENPNNGKGLASELQNFLICIEMFIAAVAHIFSFPHEPFHINGPEYWNVHGNWYDAFLSMLDISDVQEDVTEHLGVVGSSLSRRFRGRTNYCVPRGSESQYLITPTYLDMTYQSGITNTGNEYSISNNTSSFKNRYGATDNTITTTAATPAPMTSTETPKLTNIGINIVNKKEIKEYSPHFGAVPASSTRYLQNRNSQSQYNQQPQQQCNTDSFYGGDSSSISTKNDITTNNSSKSETNLTYGDGGRERQDGGNETTTSSSSNIRKSDSNTSDWLSTPTDEMIGIDVKGIEKDRIIIRQAPKDPEV